MRTTTEPSACLAIRPVSMLNDCPFSMRVTVCLDISFFLTRRMRPTRVKRTPLTLRPQTSAQLRGNETLLAQVELLDHLPVALDFLVLEVVQEFPAPSHELQQPAARRVVFLVDLEVLREHLDSLSEESNLNFGGAGVFVVELVLLD